ncbi:MAG: hypothetical protein PSN34_00320 [Urechidicola sp.]|nr:hypothetical protein [Urechidicola sp.]
MIGVVFGFIALLFLFGVPIYRKRKNKRRQIKEKVILEEFKKKCDAIIVNLEKIKIKSNTTKHKTHIEPYIIGGGFTGLIAQGLDEYNGSNFKFKEETNYGNQINIGIPYKNSIINYKFHSSMEPANLLLHFAVKKETLFYINPKNHKQYYLEFLNE